MLSHARVEDTVIIDVTAQRVRVGELMALEKQQVCCNATRMIADLGLELGDGVLELAIEETDVPRVQTTSGS